MVLQERNLRSPETVELRIGEFGSARKHFAPLECVLIHGVAAGEMVLEIVDGGGEIYARYRVKGAFKIRHMLGGGLGWQRVVLSHQSGNSVKHSRLWVDARTEFTLSSPRLQQLWNSLKGSILRSRRATIVDQKVVPFFIRWVRDETHVQKAGVYWAVDTSSWIECFLDRQASNGMIFDYACRLQKSPERPLVFGPAFSRTEESNLMRWERLPTEADVEYLLVENVYRSWQSSGNDERMRQHLPKLERALTYCMEDGLRWSPEKQLVQRPYTLDTWDFKYFGFDRKHLKTEEEIQDAVFNVHPETPMCIMHGDNSGMYQACSQMAKMFSALGMETKAEEWKTHARHFHERTNELCWNGEYYDHWIPVTPLGLDQGGIDGAKSFTLSNAYNLNRGIANHEQCVSIIRKYRALRDVLSETHFAEWVAAYPCWPKGFSGIPAGMYVNGGILSIVAGELARGAFRHGFEEYGADILSRLADLVVVNHEEADRDPELFSQPFLHCGYSNGGDRLDGIPDCWGQAAVVAAMIEGMAGVVDDDRRFEKVTLSPRWDSAAVDYAEVVVRYPASDGYVSYRYRVDHEAHVVQLWVTGNGQEWRVELLIPDAAERVKIVRNGEVVDFSIHTVESSRYAVLEVSGRVVDHIEMKWEGASEAVPKD